MAVAIYFLTSDFFCFVLSYLVCEVSLICRHGYNSYMMFDGTLYEKYVIFVLIKEEVIIAFPGIQTNLMGFELWIVGSFFCILSTVCVCVVVKIISRLKAELG